MSLKDLQAWLLEDGVRDDLNTIIRMTIRSELDNLMTEGGETSASEPDWQRLVFAGSILARSEVRADQEAALRIAIAAITLGSEPNQVLARAM